MKKRMFFRIQTLARIRMQLPHTNRVGEGESGSSGKGEDKSNSVGYAVAGAETQRVRTITLFRGKINEFSINSVTGRRSPHIYLAKSPIAI